MGTTACEACPLAAQENSKTPDESYLLRGLSQQLCVHDFRIQRSAIERRILLAENAAWRSRIDRCPLRSAPTNMKG